MGKTRNLNGDDVTKGSPKYRRNVQKKKIFPSFIRRISAEEEDDVFVDEVKGEKKMKNSSKRRTVLFIPGFRKNKKTHTNVLENDVSYDIECKDLDFVLSKDSDVNDVLNGSTRTSISSLDTLVSIDSGIDCGQISSTSSLSSIESLSCDVMQGQEAVPKGRAPIASPEDDLLLESAVDQPKEVNNSDYDNMTFTHNNSASSFCTLSDNNSSCSCDSCCDSDSSGSESDSDFQQNHGHSDSDSDLDSKSANRSRRRQHSDSDSDSDWDDEHSSSFFLPMQNSFSVGKEAKSLKSEKQNGPSKKLSRSTSRLNLSLKKIVRSGSKLDLSLKKIMRSSSKPELSSKKDAKKEKKFKVPELKSSPKRVLPKRPPTGKKTSSSVTKPSSKNEKLSSSHIMSSSETKLNSVPLVPTIKSVSIDNSRLYDNFSRTSSESSSSGSVRSSNIRCGITLGNSIKTIKLQRSKSDCSSKHQHINSLRLNTSQPLDSCRTQRQKLNNSPALQVRSRSLLENNCDIDFDIDTCKSPKEVRQAMEKTAFWIENNDYDMTPDVSSTESLLQTSQNVTETDLCNQIIGIYFGEENDSDSSLSSSCLDNSMETSDENTSPVTSTPLETNLDDFTMATFVPASYQMAEAKTRKISKAEPIQENKVKQHETLKTRHQRDVLQERVNNSTTKQRPSSNHVSVSDKPCQNRKSKLLTEEEIDTLTKIHTICNGQRTVQYLNLSDIPVNFKHYPPPKRASKVVWNEELCSDEALHHTPQPSRVPGLPRPILQQKPKDFTYPYQEDEPSPIVITKVRRSKSLPRKSREWPW